MNVRSERGVFATTRWTLVLAAGQTESGAARTALEELCELYWPPLYTYARRQGHPVDEAQDLTQAFFTRLIEKHYVGAANAQRGRFRSFLLASFKHFIANEYERQRAQKRGGGWRPVAIEMSSAERFYAAEPADATTPEALFERQWARGVLSRVLAALRREYAAAGKLDAFEQLRGSLTGAKRPHADIARELGTTEGAVKVRVHRMRRRFRELLEAEVGATVAEDREIDDEIRHLIAVLGR